MFQHSLDNKPTIIDDKGNEIVDLCRSMFNRSAAQIESYTVRKMTHFYEMRPDLVANAEYGDTDAAEFILKFSGISNPFTLGDDDILMIPNESEATAKTAAVEKDEDDRDIVEQQVRNFYKFVNQDYKSDSTSYDELKEKEMKSAVVPDTIQGDYIVPYISEDGTSSVTIRNGRMYFGEDSGLNTASIIKTSTTNIDEHIQNIIDSTATALSDKNCMYNGQTLANFVRTQMKNNYNNTNGNNSTNTTNTQ